jgi:hypothetical protein
MSMDTVVMIARYEQEYRMEQVAKLNRLRDAEVILRGKRTGLFARRTRNVN